MCDVVRALALLFDGDGQRTADVALIVPPPVIESVAVVNGSSLHTLGLRSPSRCSAPDLFRTGLVLVLALWQLHTQEHCVRLQLVSEPPLPCFVYDGLGLEREHLSDVGLRLRR